MQTLSPDRYCSLLTSFRFIDGTSFSATLMRLVKMSKNQMQIPYKMAKIDRERKKVVDKFLDET
jgi:hypothetical protein